MMTWTLYILMLTSEGQWATFEGRTFTKPKTCYSAAAALKGIPVGGGVIYTAVCKEFTNV